MRYDQLLIFISLFKPQSIIEIGTNRGDRGVAMCKEALRHRRTVSYTGYDVFDTQDQTFHDNALNGKGFFNRNLIARRFDAIAAGSAGFRFNLIEGTTKETLHKHNKKADFVFIDGDHRKDVIKDDYLSVKKSKVIVFDDYYSESDLGKIDVTKWGCNSTINAIPSAIILPEVDSFPDVGEIRMAAIVRPHIFWGTKIIWL